MVAETGAGQHGVATATAAALFGLECVVYMGEVDTERQALNVFRMRLLGAEVRRSRRGSRTLKDAVNEALRDWVATVETTHYCLGSVMGPHPYPWMVREFQRVVGDEAREQCRALLGGRDPDLVVACVGRRLQRGRDLRRLRRHAGPAGRGGSGRRVGHRAGRPGRAARHALVPAPGRVGADPRGRSPSPPASTTRGSAPSTPTCPIWAGPSYYTATDAEVLDALQLLARTEGIIPALEPAHALAWLVRAVASGEVAPGSTVLLTLSGRGDKDAEQVMRVLG